MMRALAAEWTKLWRARQMLAVWGTMAAFTCLFAVLFFSNAGDAPTAPGPGRGGSFLTRADLAEPQGLTITLQVASQLLGIVTFVLVAGSHAAEYSQGTLKMLLARDPVRLRLLAGKTLALLLFATVGIVAAALLQGAAASGMAAARGIATSGWWTAANLASALGLLARVALAAWVWGLLGLLLATVLRSGPAAIGLGIGYTIVVESILGLVLQDIHPYLPGQVLQAFVSGGQAPLGQASGEPLSLEGAAGLGLAYTLLFAGISALVFQRRDVTA